MAGVDVVWMSSGGAVGLLLDFNEDGPDYLNDGASMGSFLS